MELREWQSALKDRVIAHLKEGFLVALQSPTGSGKTIFSLLVSLAVRGKVIYAVRTHNEFYPVYREAKRLGKRFSFLVGKSRACLFAEEGVDAEDIKCNLCELSSPGKVKDEGDSPFRILEDLKRRGKEEGFCPYFTLLSSLEDTEVLGVTYPYLFSPWLRDALDLNLQEFAIVVDEAHNLDYLNDLAERRLSVSTIEFAMKQVKSDQARSILVKLREEIKAVISNEERYIEVKGYPRLSEDELKLLTEEYEDLRKEMVKSKSIRKLYVGSVIKFYSSMDDEHVFSYKGALIVKPLTSIPFVSVLNREDVPVILMSGTMYPRDYLEKVLGIKRKMFYLDVERELRTKVTGGYDCFLAVDVTTSYSTRSAEMWKRYASHLLRIYHYARANVLAVFPSYTIMEEVMKLIKVRKFVEGSKSVLDEVVSSSLEGKVIIAGVARGKLTEGIELTSSGSSLISDVALCGIPYPSVDDYLRLRSEYIYKLTGESLRDALVEISAMVAVRQAIGRAVRSKEDRANVWLLDKRFDSAWWKVKINCLNPKKVRL